MLTDPIADLLIQIKNGYSARKEKAEIPFSNLKKKIVDLLSKEGYVGKIDIRAEGIKKYIIVELKYEDKKPKLNNVVKISKPSKRVYAAKDKIPKVLGGLGRTIVSTSKGIMTDKEARAKGVGGELICKIW